MANKGKTGVSEALGPGERMERARNQRRALVLCALMAAGGACGLALAIAEPKGGGLLQGAIAPWVAVALAAAWLIAVVGGSLWYKTHADEIDLAAQMWGQAAGGAAIVLLYPVWYLLARAALVPAPDANVVFLALYVVMTGAYLWKKFR
jgi:hypothetical protein